MPEYDETTDLYKGLVALSGASFPKRCLSCGRKYETAEEFMRMTTSVNNSSGLKQTDDSDETKIVELFRNCVCGSTLMDEFKDRRDDTQAGKRKREIFEKTLAILMGDGVSREQGRFEIFQFMRGEKSRIIDRLLIKKRPVINCPDQGQ